jgi:hypothetical protein
MVDTTVVHSMPVVVSSVSRDYFDLAVLVGVLLVAPVAGLLGALFGGRQARHAALEAVQLQAAIEREAAVRRLKARLGALLEFVKTFVRSTLKYDETVPFIPTELEYAIQVFDRYQYIAEDLVHVESEEFVWQVNALMTVVRLGAARLLFVDQQLIKENEAGRMPMDEVRRTRRAHVDRLSDLPARAEELLGQLATLR